MYYPDAADSNPVFIHITVRNTGTDTLRFKLADDRMFSIDFNAYTIKNERLSQTETLVRKRTTNQTVYFREIALEAGEEYSFVENLKEYLTVANPSVYYVDLTFYPELYRFRDERITSNRLTLEVRPSPSAASSSSIPVEAGTVRILQPEAIPPDQVVERTIVARQKSLWDQYFLYMDVEAMLERTPSQKRRYRAASADERERMIDAYKSDLMQSRIDGDIVAVPERFQIEKTVYSKTEGSVVVTEWFNNRTYYEKKSYTYRLRQREGVWQIYDYTVVNLGTE
ncbi:hypothetical protein [Treponema socranskii]|uniref:hypothetical protein n=1 Tax=Treponema socranskii TaxID=53419 RepID=UPI0028EFF760|nr:hypothetical protein [Treponema socranskii]